MDVSAVFSSIQRRFPSLETLDVTGVTALCDGVTTFETLQAICRSRGIKLSEPLVKPYAWMNCYDEDIISDYGFSFY